RRSGHAHVPAGPGGSRGHPAGVPLAGAGRRGQGRHRRLPFRALGSAGHGLAAVAELLQADLEDGRSRQVAVHVAARRAAGGCPEILLARSGEECAGRVGTVEPDVSFTPRGAAPPTDVTLVVDRDRGTGVLRWKPNPAGRKPVKYRIYGSDE